MHGKEERENIFTQLNFKIDSSPNIEALNVLSTHEEPTSTSSDSDCTSDTDSIISDCVSNTDSIPIDGINQNVDDDELFKQENNILNINANFNYFNIDKRIMFTGSNLSISDVKIMIQAFTVKFGLTKKMQEETVSLIKALAGPEFDSFSYTPYLISKDIAPPKNSIVKHHYCDTCNVIISNSFLSEKNKKSAICQSCKVEFDITPRSEKFFLTLSVKYQLETLLNKKEVQLAIDKALEDSKVHSTNSIDDVTDSILHKKNINNQISFNFSTDGAQFHKSSKKSTWPLQIILNIFRSNKRFKYPILLALWKTEKEPTPQFMDLYLSTLENVCNELKLKGIDFVDCSTGETRNMTFTPFCGCVDTVARPIMQNRIQFNGYSGCSWCYHKGHYSGSMRYPLENVDPELRSHESHLNDINRVLYLGKTVNGVKGTCRLINFEKFDIVWNLPPDYMHGTLLGVLKQLYSEFKSSISKDGKRLLSQRMSKIKLCRDLRKNLRTLENVNKYKALEWKIWLLYISGPCLHGILEEKKYVSYLQLINSIFILLKDSIPYDEVDFSEYELFKFSGECQILYGINFMNFNVHTLTHYGESVRQTGPLWANSAFPFENAIYSFSQQINAPNGCTQQIAVNWLRKCAFQRRLCNNKEMYAETAVNFIESLFEDKSFIQNCIKVNDTTLIGSSIKNINVEKHMRNIFDDPNLEAVTFDRCIHKSMYFHSVKYTRALKTDDTVMLLKSGRIIQIHYFVLVNNECYLYGKEFFVQNNSFNGKDSTPIVKHILEVKKKSNVPIICKISEYDKKLIVIDTGETTFLSYLSNTFETH